MRILLIGYVFPPGGGVGMFKISKFTKYLSELGHDITVLTLDDEIQPPPHNNQFKEILDYPSNIVRTRYRAEWSGMSYDDGIRWIPDLTYHTLKLLLSEDFDVVYQTATPHFPLVNIVLVNRISDAMTVIDLRDAWTTSVKYEKWENKPLFTKHKIWQKSSEYLEPLVFSNSDLIISNTEKMAKEYKKKYPRHSKKIEYINNGFDPCDYPNIDNCVRLNNSDPFTIVYPGKFRKGIKNFVEALSQVYTAELDIEFIHFGDKDHPNFSLFEDSVTENDLDNIVEYKGYQELNTVFETLSKADLGLAITKPFEKSHTPAKIFDYMACDLPILGIDTLNGSMSEILSEFENARVVEHGSTDLIQTHIREFYRERPTCLDKDWGKIFKYSSESNTKKLERLIQSRL